MTMKAPEFPAILQQFFVRRLMGDRGASPNTVAAYRDGLRQYVRFLVSLTGRTPSKIRFSDITATTVFQFLDDLEKSRELSVRSRNLRLTTIHSFVKYASYQVPECLQQFEQILAIPSKRLVRTEVCYLTRREQEAILETADRRTWYGRRNYLFLLLALQTGLRLSEMTSLRRQDIAVSMAGSHVEVTGKGRKHRSVPVLKSTSLLLSEWCKELPEDGENAVLFPSIKGTRLTVHGVRGIVMKSTRDAGKSCETLLKKRVTMHSLRHSTAMDLLQAGVDSSVIALWLGHESVQTTQIYIHATLTMKEEALTKANFVVGTNRRFAAGDDLLGFLNSL
ncbi:tyrosine-type recombinase/integrase [Caballeronia sp. M23-90]